MATSIFASDGNVRREHGVEVSAVGLSQTAGDYGRVERHCRKIV